MSVISYDDVKYQRFNESLDQQEIIIAGFPFQASRILFDMDQTAYVSAYDEFYEQELTDIKQAIAERYPSLIAYNLRRAEWGEGADDPVRKLLHLKDTWESIIYMLYALVMGELRHRKQNLRSIRLFSHTDPSGVAHYTVKFSKDRIMTDALKRKITNMKGIIEFSKTQNLGFKCEQIDLSLLDDLSYLQDKRNDTSHHVTPTREEAEKELGEIFPIFEAMLFKTRFLEQCKILRFDTFSTFLRCEFYNGRSLERQFMRINSTSNLNSYILGLGGEHIFVEWENEYFSLSPFIHFLKDTTGHESYLCFYKQLKSGRLNYEPLKIRHEHTFTHVQPRFDAEIQELVDLLVP